MHLTCRKAVVLFAVALVACHESTAPTTVTTGFSLDNINGRLLPTYQAPTPGGLTVTVLYASLALDGNGHATMVEHRQQSDGTTTFLTSSYKYEINGSDIFFSFLVPCPINAICVSPPHGTISPDTGDLALEIGQFGDALVVYHFKRIRPD
jgi:hypothetical protein